MLKHLFNAVGYLHNLFSGRKQTNSYTPIPYNPKQREVPLSLRVFLTPHHAEDCPDRLYQNIDRLAAIAEKRNMTLNEFANSLDNAHESITDYIGHDEIMEISSKAGDEWAEIGKIEIFFNLLEEGLTLPSSYDILVLHNLKARDKNIDICQVEITLDDVKEYMGTPKFKEAFETLEREVETSQRRKRAQAGFNF